MQGGWARAYHCLSSYHVGHVVSAIVRFLWTGISTVNRILSIEQEQQYSKH